MVDVMLAAPSKVLPPPGDFAYETKWDGFRCVVESRDGTPVLYSRSGRIINSEFPEVADDLVGLPGGTILDGEVCWMEGARSDFNRLQNRKSATSTARRGHLRYQVFDILSAGTQSCRQLPYRDRRTVLDRLVLPKASLSDDFWGGTVFKPGYWTDPARAWASVERYDLEGLIVKPMDSRYVEGQRGPWLKVKRKRRGTYFIIGYTAGEGHRTGQFGALVLGTHDATGWRYGGKCGTGYPEDVIADLIGRFSPLLADFPALSKPEYLRAMRHIQPDPVVWLHPELECSIEYDELGKDGIPRFPSFKGLIR